MNPGAEVARCDSDRSGASVGVSDALLEMRRCGRVSRGAGTKRCRDLWPFVDNKRKKLSKPELPMRAHQWGVERRTANPGRIGRREDGLGLTGTRCGGPARRRRCVGARY